MVHSLVLCSMLVTNPLALPRSFLSSQLEADHEGLPVAVHLKAIEWKKPVAQKHPKEKLSLLHGGDPQVPPGLQKPKSQSAHKTNRTHEMASSESGGSRSSESFTTMHNLSAKSQELYFVFFALSCVAVLLFFCWGNDFLEAKPQSEREDQGAAIKISGPPKQIKEQDNTKGVGAATKSKNDATATKSENDAQKIWQDGFPAGRNTKDTLVKLESDEKAAGTWINAYRRADICSREALELLFRCGIVPIDEFADSFVGQEKIDESVWISTQMLRRRSLQDWVDSSPQAIKSFEADMKGCFSAPADDIGSLYGNSDPNTPVSSAPDLREAYHRPPSF